MLLGSGYINEILGARYFRNVILCVSMIAYIGVTMYFNCNYFTLRKLQYKVIVTTKMITEIITSDLLT